MAIAANGTAVRCSDQQLPSSGALFRLVSSKGSLDKTLTMLKTASVFILTLIATTVAADDEPCRPIVPEVAHDLAAASLPTSVNRWRAIGRLWAESARPALEDVERMLKGGSLSPAVDLIQGRTNDVLREALLQRQDELAHSLLDLWLKPLDVVARRDRLLVYYLTPDQRLSEAKLDQPSEMWVGPDGIESVLYSAMYLAGAMDIVAAIVRRPADERSATMTDFARRVSGLALSHYTRWAFGPPGIWQVRGWGCDASGLDLVSFTRQRLDRSLGNGSIAYCQAPTDIDMLIMIGLVNLLRTADAAHDLVVVPASDRRRLLDLVQLQARFFASRLVYGSATTDWGQPVRTVDFDPGAWSDHPSQWFGADQEAAFPDRRPKLNKGIGWDFSHGARIAWAFLTLADSSVHTGVAWNSVTDALAHQIAYRVLDDSAELPRFRNFLDGSNGWYSVNLADDADTGIPPFGLSRAFLAMPWARLSQRDATLMKATARMWQALAAPTTGQCELLKQVYAEGSVRKGQRPIGAPISGPYYNLNLLPFMAVSPIW